MIIKTYYLKDLSSDFKDSNAYFEFYELNLEEEIYKSDFPRPGMLILPGGAYLYTSPREGAPIALAMLCEGFNAFVLHYTTKTKYPAPHLEVAFTMNYIREHYKEFHLLDLNLSVIGFSAGGHLAASYSYLYPELADSLHINEENIRPFSTVLGYPVIMMNEYAEGNTRNTITGKDPSLYQKLSVEKNITDNYPPTYLFSTENDACVPIKNSYELIKELEKHNIPHRTDIFPFGLHGGSIFLRGCYQEYGEVHKKAKDNYIWIRHMSDFIFDLIENK